MGREKPKRKEKEEEERSGKKVGPGLNGKKLGASDSGAELGAKIYGARATGGEPPAMSPPPVRFEHRSSAPETLASRRVSSAPASIAPS